MAIQINIKSVSKIVQSDNWNGGCNPDTYHNVHIEKPQGSFATIIAAFRVLVNDNSIKPTDIQTSDSNVYCDLKSGDTKTVIDNMYNGIYRCTYNRTENKTGKKPTAKERENDLLLADYDIYFTISIVELTETELAKLLAISEV